VRNARSCKAINSVNDHSLQTRAGTVVDRTPRRFCKTSLCYIIRIMGFWILLSFELDGDQPVAFILESGDGSGQVSAGRHY